MPRVSEDELIARYFAPLAGPGGLGLRDDAALATPRPGHDLVVTKDMLVAGVHFFADDPPDATARKALRVNLSDLAAKGAMPTGFVLGLGLPSDWTEPWLEAFVTGLAEDARRFGCPLLGGDTVAMPGPLTLSVTAFGEIEAGRMVPRAGARAGDVLYVTGTIGDAAIGLRVRSDARTDQGWLAGLDPKLADVMVARLQMPQPRLALREALVAHADAAMDVSDGLVGDLQKMLRLGGLTTRLAAADIPLSDAVRAAVRLEPSLLTAALTGGDDYEIVCAVPPDKAAAFESAAAAAGTRVTRIGIAERGSDGLAIHDEAGAHLSFASPSFRHFG